MKRILSIDDEPAILECLKKALSIKGYEVSVFPDPEEALRVLRSDEHFDLVTLDIRMPGLNGFEVYEELCKIRTIPVLFITAYHKSFEAEHDSDVVQMWKSHFSEGRTDIMRKPFDLSVLFDKVEGLIGKSD